MSSALPATAAPLDHEDLLWEILLRLPPNPSSLPRASVVCKRWRSILSDAEFLRRFRKHHRRPPLLGFFAWSVVEKHVFTPVLESPDRIPAARFPVLLRRLSSDDWDFHGCRHGLCVLTNKSRRELVVWDPITGQKHHVPFPTGIPTDEWYIYLQAVVQCVSTEDGHVHGDCFSNPFKLVLMCGGSTQTLACLYESACGVWGDVVSMATTSGGFLLRPSILVKNVVYCLFRGADILAFDLERQSLGVVHSPSGVFALNNWYFRLLMTENHCLGLAYLSGQSILLWEMKSNCDGVTRWVLLQKTIQLEDLIPCPIPRKHKMVLIVGYDEDTNAIVLSTSIGNFMIELDSMQIKHVIKRDEICYYVFYPYRNFYTTGRALGWKWLDLEP